MLTYLSEKTIKKIKPFGFLIFLVPLFVLLVAYGLGEYFSAPNLFAFFPIFFTFGLIPLLDFVIGKDKTNPDEATDSSTFSQKFYYPLLPLTAVPFLFATLIWGSFVFMNWEGLSWIGQIGWIISIGIVGGTIGINVAHELVHKTSKIEQGAGGLLLSMVSYGGFKVEHVRGHHVNVSTPADASSSRYNQSLYHFLPRAFLYNFRNAWRLEATRLNRKGKKASNVGNELIWWYLLSAVFATAFTVVHGPLGFVYFLGQSFVAFTLLEIVNYLEHYGLHREKLANGRYERPTIFHSWNSNYFFTNLLLFQLQRHSDHHANPKRRYQTLRQFETSPQLPAGYPTMILLALFPPLWRKVMNPKVDAYYKMAA